MNGKRKYRPYKNSVAERIRRLFAQGIEIDEIAKRTGSTREYVMTVTYKLRVAAEQRAQNEAEIEAALAVMYPGDTAESKPEPEPEVTEVLKTTKSPVKRNYHENRIGRASERFGENLILLHTHLKNPDRTYSTWRYCYVSPITNGKRNKFLGTADNLTAADARRIAARYDKLIMDGKDPFPVGVRVTGWTKIKKTADPVAPVDCGPSIVVPFAAAERVEVAEAPEFVPPFLKEAPVFKNEEPKPRAKRAIKQKAAPMPEPKLTLWGSIKAKLRGWLA